ncbi:unnamed protein product, partial [Musa banksii]
TSPTFTFRPCTALLLCPHNMVLLYQGHKSWIDTRVYRCCCCGCDGDGCDCDYDGGGCDCD